MPLFKRDGLDRKLKRALGDVVPPTFPELHLRILRELRSPDADAAKIGEVLQWDPGLVVRLLKVVNSAAFAASQEVRDPGHAAALMGRGPLEQLVTGVAVGCALPDPSSPAYDKQRFWTAAARRAVLARQLAIRFEPATRHEAFTAALLQDIAIPVLAELRAKDYAVVLEEWHASPGSELHVLEREQFGFDHAEIGAALAERWGLPDALIDAIGHQNTAFEDGHGAPRQAGWIVSGLRETTHADCPLNELRPRAVGNGVEAEPFEALLSWTREEAGELAHSMFGPASAQRAA